MISALAQGTTRLIGMSPAADPNSTLHCLRSLGVVIDRRDGETIVEGRGLDGLRRSEDTLDCGNSGTTMRLLSGILAGQPFLSHLTGDASLSRRPMERIASPLRRMGATLSTAAQGRPPLQIAGRRPLTPIDFVSPIPSAQVKSAVLLAGLFADGTTSVLEPVPTRDHTERLLGLAVEETREGMLARVSGGIEIGPLDMEIPGDCSAAVFIIGAVAIVPGSEVLIKNVGVNPHRATVLGILERWGIGVRELDRRTAGGEPVADLLVSTGDALGALTIEPSEVPACIDEIPALALTAMAAGRGFAVSGAAELRTKESDRIAVLTKGLRALGVEVEELADGFAFQGKNELLGATIRTEGDHRIAMAFAMASLRHPMITIDDPACVSVSFPTFFETLKKLQGDLE